jgi:hypothetical protein
LVRIYGPHFWNAAGNEDTTLGERHTHIHTHRSFMDFTHHRQVYALGWAPAVP